HVAAAAAVVDVARRIDLAAVVDDDLADVAGAEVLARGDAFARAAEAAEEGVGAALDVGVVGHDDAGDAEVVAGVAGAVGASLVVGAAGDVVERGGARAGGAAVEALAELHGHGVDRSRDAGVGPREAVVAAAAVVVVRREAGALAGEVDGLGVRDG